MRMILSPAKKMVREEDVEYRDLPRFLDCTQHLLEELRGKSYEELKTIWNCSDALVEENLERISTMDLHGALSPAILSYEGIAFQYMAPGVFTDAQTAYIQEHLRILSGFYGVLRPMDGVTPYRLEMGAKMAVDGHKDLYRYWGSRLADSLCQETELIVNLASKEYSKAVAPQLKGRARLLECSFVQPKKGKLVEQSTACKMARGEMVRFMAECGITAPEDLKAFDRQGYHYSPEHSTEEKFVFIKEEHHA